MDLDWHPSGGYLAIADHAGQIHLMYAPSGQTRALGSHKAQAAMVAFSPDGEYLLSGGWEREIICWDLRTMQRVLTVERKTWIAQFRADSRVCALSTPSGIELHAFERPNCREFAEDLGPRLLRAAFSADGRWLTASADQSIGLWDLSAGGPGAVIKKTDEARPSFPAGGTELFAGGNEQCQRWRIFPSANTSGPPTLRALQFPVEDRFTSVCTVSNVIAFTGVAGTRVGKLENGLITELDQASTPRGVNGMSPDARWLAIYRPYTPVLNVYSLPAMNRVAMLTNQANVGNFEFSPAGDEVAVSTHFGVEIWSTLDWARTRVITNFMGMLYAPSSTTCWLTKDFSTAGLYETRSLEPLLPLPAGMLPLALSGDGRRLAVSVGARRLQVWDMQEVRSHLRDLGLDWGRSAAEAAVLGR
jgi:hypothetical protein